MIISIEWHDQQFNVAIASKEGRDPFMTVMGCRIASGKNGDFVSYPARKNESTGKWWNHVRGSEEFNSVVLAKALENRPAEKKDPRDLSDIKDDIPFAPIHRGISGHAY